MTDDDRYKLTCLIEGDKNAFLILISRDAYIDQLTELIYEKRKKGLFRDIDPADLTLLKVEINLEPLRGHFSKLRLDRHHHRTELNIFSRLLSEFWNEQPPARHLHVFVRLPSRDNDPTPLPPSSQQLHLTGVSEARAALAPSSVAASVGKYKQEQINHPIYNGRPIERRGPPVVIYNEHLARLKHELHHLADVPEPSADYVALTGDLFRASATIYDSEKERGNKIYTYLESLLGSFLDCSVWAHEERSNRKPTEAHAIVSKPIENDYFGKKRAAVAYVELKNELGVRGDGGLQAALSLRKYVAQEHYNGIRNASCCPCIIVSVAGPYLLIAGAVFVEVFSVQNFTTYIYMGGDPFEEQVYYVAKVFDAVARAVKALERQYFFLKPESRPEIRLPSPTYLPNSPLPANESSFKFKERFMYERRYLDSYRRSLFLAEYEGKTVVVKFCERYGEDAHRTLADAGLAPKLHYCSEMMGGVFMVVMEQVDGRDSYSEFRHRDLPRTVLDDIKRALGKLHDEQLVYGDMRRPNIMVVKRPKSRDDDVDGEVENENEWCGLLIDFDWSGRVGVVKYPPTLNTCGEIKWAKGVESATTIRPGHDLDMLEKIIDGTDE